MNQKKFAGLVVTISLCTISCAETDSTDSNTLESSQAISTAPEQLTQRSNSDDYVLVPGGRQLHRSCVHELPDGVSLGLDHSLIDGDGKIVGKIPLCEFPALTNSEENQRQILPTINGWVEEQQYTVPGTDWIKELSVDFTVPLLPAQLGAGQTVFLFPGVENIPYSYIMQPVIQYGSSSAGNSGAYAFGVASWYVYKDSNGNISSVHSTLKYIYPGQIVHGSVHLRTGTYCPPNGLVCQWTTKYSIGSGSFLSDQTINVWEVYPPRWAVLGALEAYNLTACGQYPVTDTTFSMTYFSKVSNGVTYSVPFPGWSPFVHTSSPSCGYGITVPATNKATLHY